MPVDFLTLLRRDHTDLHRELTSLIDPDATTRELRSALDGVRLGLTAHAGAEDLVLGRIDEVPALRVVLAQTRRAHLAQEGALASLVAAMPRTRTWLQRALHLRELLECHMEHLERHLASALREHLPGGAYAALAGAFATERLRQLTTLAPSGPVLSIPPARVSR